MTTSIDTIIFDLGGVLIDWNPRYLYRKLFANEEEVEWFLTNICTGEWNDEQDAGRLFNDACQMLIKKHPEWSDAIMAYHKRWDEMLGGKITESVDILQEIKNNKKYKLYALTNWSAETFPIAKQRYDFLSWFDGIVVSGEELTRKPFPIFYKILFERYKVDPSRALFIDDNYKNIEGAKAVGLHTIHFTSANQLQLSLEKMAILGA